MTIEALKWINDVLGSIAIPYDYQEFNQPIDSKSTYWVGEYSEQTSTYEDGCDSSQFILTGTGRDSWMPLEEEKAKIRMTFPESVGKTGILPNGNTIAVFYDSANPVPTGDAFFKRLQVNLQVKEWKVN